MGIPLSVPLCDLSKVLERGRALLREDGSFSDIDATPCITEAFPVWEVAVREEVESFLALNMNDPLPRCAILDYLFWQDRELREMEEMWDQAQSVRSMFSNQSQDPTYEDLWGFRVATSEFLSYVAGLLPEGRCDACNSRWEFLFRVAIEDYNGIQQSAFNFFLSTNPMSQRFECVRRYARVIWAIGVPLCKIKDFLWYGGTESSGSLWLTLRGNPDDPIFRHGRACNEWPVSHYTSAISFLQIITGQVPQVELDAAVEADLRSEPDTIVETDLPFVMDPRRAYLAMLSDLFAMNGQCGEAAAIVEQHAEDFARELAGASSNSECAEDFEVDIFRLRISRRLADLWEAAGDPGKAAAHLEELPGALEFEGKHRGPSHGLFPETDFPMRLLSPIQDPLAPSAIRLDPNWSRPDSLKEPMAFKIAELWDKAGDTPRAIRALERALGEGETPPRNYHARLSCLYLKCCDSAKAYEHLRAEESIYPEIGEIPIVSFVLQAAGGIPGIESDSRKADLEKRPSGKLQRELLAKSLPYFWPTINQLSPESRELWMNGCVLLFGSEESGFEPASRARWAVIDLASSVEQELRFRVFEPLRRDNLPRFSMPQSLGEMLRFLTDALRSIGPLQPRLEDLAGPEWRSKLTRQEFKMISELRNPPAHGQQSSAFDAVTVLNLSRRFLDSLVWRPQAGAPVPGRPIPARRT